MSSMSGFNRHHLRTNEVIDVVQFLRIMSHGVEVETTGEPTFLMTGRLATEGVTERIDVDWEFNGVAEDPRVMRVPVRRSTARTSA
ncbi:MULTISPECIES: hypothetical protein [Saccharothrix]|uniref:hypothetical protein n=1 Tax=Saccharothrix TaxID=2071 RepID=UPI00093DF4F0|nr:hypothetical protein [Saccharothrix sp. CB00851]OKI17539.1 hypothetical protein A6A25_40815 [Saccharothrix sp. CB00851]